MDPEVLRQVQSAEERAKEYTDRSHMEQSKVVSRFFGALTEKVEKLTELLTDSRVDRNELHGKVDTILSNTRETNGRVHKLELQNDEHEKEHRRIEEEHRDELGQVYDLIKDKESHLKMWVLKALIIVTLIGSFVWIKESRDAIISIIKVIV